VLVGLERNVKWLGIVGESPALSAGLAMDNGRGEARHVDALWTLCGRPFGCVIPVNISENFGSRT
jgi:hypothetical protein